jgi:hypothetical protein
MKKLALIVKNSITSQPIFFAASFVAGMFLGLALGS